MITRIATQKKNDKRFNIYWDRGDGEEFGLGVGEDTLVAFALTKGTDVNEARVAAIVFEDGVKTAFNMVVNLLSYRMRSEKEITDYLQKKAFSAEVAEKVIADLAEYGYVDDGVFAKAFVESRKRTSTKGPVVISRELAQKGIAEERVDDALTLYPYDEQLEVARHFAGKQARMQRKKSGAEIKQHVMRTLMGKGFSRDVSEQAVSDADIGHTEEGEWQALCAQAETAQRKYKKYEGTEYNRRMKQHLYGKGFSIELISRYLEL